MKGRTDNCIKNRFFSCIRKTLRDAIKFSGIKLKLSSTRTISKIQSKILIEFLNKDTLLKNSQSQTDDCRVKIIEIIDHIYVIE